MNPLLAQFLAEAFEGLERIASMLMQWETQPENPELINELFRLVHTLKGNSGLFDFPEMTKVLHAAEDLMDTVRSGRIPQAVGFTDQLLDSIDFVLTLCRELEEQGQYTRGHAEEAQRIASGLRAFMSPEGDGAARMSSVAEARDTTMHVSRPEALEGVPEGVLSALRERLRAGDPCFWVDYKPDEGCFFQGDDPLFLSRQTPGLLWGRVVVREGWPPLVSMDPYRCVLAFQMVAAAFREELAEHFRYVSEQVELVEIPMGWLAPRSTESAACTGSAPSLSKEAIEATLRILHSQRVILGLAEVPENKVSRFPAVCEVLENCCLATGRLEFLEELKPLEAKGLEDGVAEALLKWIDALEQNLKKVPVEVPTVSAPANSTEGVAPVALALREANASGAETVNGGGSFAFKSLKVDQVKIDRLMNLIGELVVSKNAIPYLAQRAENHYAVRELSREIKAQYSVINRIAEEMQDAIMQIRMMPVSLVFQRFPRLVRDISRRLGKEVNLVLEGEETEADKNIIESLADPLIHIVRNSLDHGLETPEVRRAAGKSAAGRLLIRAEQEADRVVIEIVDDGRGVDPNIIKRKAFEKGIIDEETLERLSERDAIHLIFAPGFSTAESVSDLSGRGVGMDVVRSAVERVNGVIDLRSEVGKGTCIRIALPLSMAVTKVMIVESDNQIFGVPMEHVVETVRIERSRIRQIKQAQTTLLRGRVVPLKALNQVLGISAEPTLNENNEYAVLVVRFGGEVVGIFVDHFHETVDVIQKPMSGVLAGMNAYSGSALLGDGSILMVLNLKEIV